FLDTLVPNHSKNGVYRSEDGGESWRLVHQFLCPGSANFPGAEPVGQIAFAPDDDHDLVYAAGGCAITVSNDAGNTWVDHSITDGTTAGTVWHVAVAPRQSRQGLSASGVCRRARSNLVLVRWGQPLAPRQRETSVGNLLWLPRSRRFSKRGVH